MKPLFIIFNSDLIQSIGAFSAHVFADDLNILIRAPIEKKLEQMINFPEQEGTRVCSRLFEYSKKWKQPINVSKSVYQIFHTQLKLREVTIKMNSAPIECVKHFKYLGYTWTDRLSMHNLVRHCLDEV